MFSNQEFDFGNLSLSGVQASAGVAGLPPGRYVVKTKDAKLESTKANDGSKFLFIRLVDLAGKGAISDRINVFLRGKEEATKIGLGQLKALCAHGGHPDPDNVGKHGVGALNGLTVGIIVGSETYLGEKRSRVSGYCEPSDVRGYEGSAPAATGGSIGAADSDIPF